MPAEHPVDDGRSTSHAGLDEHGVDRAIPATSPAFHAGVAIGDVDSFVVEGKNPMGANLQAHAATRAFIGAYFKSNHVLQIDQIFHRLFLK